MNFDNIKPYFGMSRTMYLQSLCNKWGDFKVSWNFTLPNGEIGFTKKRSVMELWSEDYSHPSKCRLEKVMHREAMPYEVFVEIDDEPEIATQKLKKTTRLCQVFNLEFAVYKSRKGYHVSVLDPEQLFGRKKIIELIQSDLQFVSSKVTWSLEWSEHWKQKGFFIKCIYHSQNYVHKFL